MTQRTCIFDGCENSTHGRGLCSTHLSQLKRGHHLTPAGSKKINVGKSCYGPECTRPATHKGMCRAHYDQKRNRGVLEPLTPRRRKARPGTTCTFAGCGKPRKRWELCAGHYDQLVRGEELRVLRGSPGADVLNFWSKVDKRGPDECWPWLAPLGENGYGSAYINRRTGTAHRHSWVLEHGPVPDGLVVDHRCSNRACVNPKHLRTVPQQLNAADRAYFPNNTSGYRNVHFDKARGQWYGAFRNGDGRVFVGRFDSPEEAAEAVARRKAEYYGYDFRDSLDGTL